MTETRVQSVDGAARPPRNRGRSGKAASTAPSTGSSERMTDAKAPTAEVQHSRPGQQAQELSARRTPETAADEDASVRVIRLTAVDRRALIAMTAYYRAQQRNFEPGQELEDWLAAEAEVDAQLSTGSE